MTECAHHLTHRTTHHVTTSAAFFLYPRCLCCSLSWCPSLHVRHQGHPAEDMSPKCRQYLYVNCCFNWTVKGRMDGWMDRGREGGREGGSEGVRVGGREGVFNLDRLQQLQIPRNQPEVHLPWSVLSESHLSLVDLLMSSSIMNVVLLLERCTYQSSSLHSGAGTPLERMGFPLPRRCGSGPHKKPSHTSAGLGMNPHTLPFSINIL